MTVTLMNAFFQKLQPRIINDRAYRRFQNYAFREELLSDRLNINLEKYERGFSNFLDICKKILNHQATRKQKSARRNHLPFMNKTFSKEIMKKRRLKNKFLENRTDCNKREYSKQRNYCVSRQKIKKVILCQS